MDFLLRQSRDSPRNRWSQGRFPLFLPPHVLQLEALAVAGLFAGEQVEEVRFLPDLCQGVARQIADARAGTNLVVGSDDFQAGTFFLVVQTSDEHSVHNLLNPARERLVVSQTGT